MGQSKSQSGNHERVVFSVSDELSDVFDVVGVGKHINRRHPRDSVFPFREGAEVAELFRGE